MSSPREPSNLLTDTEEPKGRPCAAAQGGHDDSWPKPPTSCQFPAIFGLLDRHEKTPLLRLTTSLARRKDQEERVALVVFSPGATGPLRSCQTSQESLGPNKNPTEQEQTVSATEQAFGGGRGASCVSRSEESNKPFDFCRPVGKRKTAPSPRGLFRETLADKLACYCLTELAER
jgi:hypothetical protein